MKYIKLFENFTEFNSEIKNRRQKDDNWSMNNIDDIINSANDIRMLIKGGNAIEILNLLSNIIKNGLDKKIISYPNSSRTDTALYYYLCYLIDSNRVDVLDKIYELGYTDKISGNLSEEQKNNLSSWLENSRKVDNKEPFYEFLNDI
jgi:hypothetical protein